MRAFYQLGSNLKVPLRLHKNNRQRLCNCLKARDDVKSGSVILLQGGETQCRYSSDRELLFRQESYFHWAFGVLEPDVFGTIDVDTGKAELFFPKLHPDYAVWMGKLEDKDHFKAKYEVDDCHWVCEMPRVLFDKNPSEVLTLRGKNTDSDTIHPEATFDGIEKFKVNNTSLFPEMSECRVFKSAEEIEVLRHANKISSEAHRELMRRIEPGMHEFQMESIFHDYCYRNGGMRWLAYTGICACGPSGAVLHYGHAGAANNQPIRDGDLCLFDLGAEYYCYTSDITTTFPANGKFTEKQKVIYNAVLDANRSVFKACKPGVSWLEMHYLAERTILTHLKNNGIIVGDLDDMMDCRFGAVFMPHGLGHFLGIDVHDVAGYPKGGTERILKPGLKSLRTTRALDAGMVITIEPGCYFIESQLDAAFANPKHAKFMVKERIDEYRGSGGVRIEDTVTITETGIENLTDVPRTVEEIEKFMADARKGQ
ncbi:xaa-Pro dipeptidase-like isoform X2 [Tubulanus polymorphus]|uniref:xaa-Pro dipeptidase-like isoform X2 n=1 Tax=Tubulanus polymorphus TaxID=672921 RepID=UPI003DA3111E